MKNSRALCAEKQHIEVLIDTYRNQANGFLDALSKIDYTALSYLCQLAQA